MKAVTIKCTKNPKKTNNKAMHQNNIVLSNLIKKYISQP